MPTLTNPHLDRLADDLQWKLIPYGRTGRILFYLAAWAFALADVALEATRNARAKRSAD